VFDSCEYDTETTGSIEGGNCLHCLSDYQVPKKDSVHSVRRTDAVIVRKKLFFASLKYKDQHKYQRVLSVVFQTLISPG
jgi:hypothetical protein